ncbi:A/G-specific adenine glycosylase [hydrothermal vent metagenome]|uniref:Adenine DNA glycosylase n=1 Tax=hydrothermal vent metagenome TaxID=652676 RepID=A0A1W1BB02_9ZZZZ
MKQTHQLIQKWYKDHGRVDLPWRTTNDPYHIYLSEVMLQQTQVKTVLERYYFPFLKKFPTLKKLGNAPLDDVLKMWEGLGYYNRAKNLHKTAGAVNELPSDIDALIKLPGIGKNTAHAVATFAFKKAVPIMEANVKRILCRLYKLKTPTDKTLWEIAYDLVDKENPFDYNQAMMDIGATLCTPKNPSCDTCPLHDICQGQEEPTLYPTKKKRMVPTREENIMISVYNDKLSLTQRSGKFLHGLWGFPSLEVPLCASEYIGDVSHAYTHFKLKCKVYVYDTPNKEEEHYFTTAQIQKLAISKVDNKIVKLYLDTIQTY